MPRVSVIIPTYNRQQFIARAIDSVLSQTFKDFEIIVVDDGSTDQTQQVLAGYRDKIRTVYQHNRGISAARNQGIDMAAGEYVAFLDSDDTWAPEKLAVQVQVLDQNPEIGLVHHRLIMLNEQGQKIGMKPKHPCSSSVMTLIEEGGDLPTSSVIVRRLCFEKAGKFDETLPIMEDFEMWLRIGKNHGILEVKDQHLAFYYRHGSQITRNRVKVYESTVQLNQKILQNFPELPGPSQKTVLRRLYRNQYTLGRAYYDEGRFANAALTVSRAICRYPLIGALFIYPMDHWPSKVLKLLKPYGLLLVAGWRSVFKRGAHEHRH